MPNPSLRSRINTKEHPWHPHDHVADIHRLGNYAGICCVGGFSECYNLGATLTLEMDASQHVYSSARCLRPGILLPRVSTMVCVCIIFTP